MADQDLIIGYNYDEFVFEKFHPWLNFEESPALGEKPPEFMLWALDGEETHFSEVVSQHLYTVVEFGSFT